LLEVKELEYGLMEREVYQRSFDTQIAPDYDGASQLASQAILEGLDRLSAEREKSERLRLVLSAGRTPIQTYEILASNYLSEFDWSRVDLYQMDEYIDSVEEDRDLCRYLRTRIIEPLGIRSVYLLDREVIGDGRDNWRRAIRNHEANLKSAGGIDLALHGIGVNGHIGFNEPASSRHSVGRVIDLSASTRASISSQPVPAHGVTLGLSVLIAAKESVLIASGAHKAQAVTNAIDGPVSEACPASWLRCARKTTVVIDVAAATYIYR
jgi:6-phosphogluconolactonase/glucosamine-6-phosphate isomerase/deaminase